MVTVQIITYQTLVVVHVLDLWIQLKPIVQLDTAISAMANVTMTMVLHNKLRTPVRVDSVL